MERIQLFRRKGWRMPPNTVKVDRSTPWGNPWVVGTHGTRTLCVYRYRKLLAGYATLAESISLADQKAYVAYIHEHIAELHGKNLACWCKIGVPCHADILLEAVEQSLKTESKDA